MKNLQNYYFGSISHQQRICNKDKTIKIMAHKQTLYKRLKAGSLKYLYVIFNFDATWRIQIQLRPAKRR